MVVDWVYKLISCVKKEKDNTTRRTWREGLFVYVSVSVLLKKGGKEARKAKAGKEGAL